MCDLQELQQSCKLLYLSHLQVSCNLWAVWLLCSFFFCFVAASLYERFSEGNEWCENGVYCWCSHFAPVQAAAIHFESVARREIGTFTAPKYKSRSKLLTPPASGKEPEKRYSRVPISYSILDSIGHCFEVNWILNPKTEFESTHLPLFPMGLGMYSTMHYPISIV